MTARILTLSRACAARELSLVPCTSRGALTLLALVAAVAPARAQLASALLRTGDPLPAFPGHVVSAIQNTAANRTSGFAATINSSDGLTNLAHVFGGAGVARGAIVRTRSTALAGYAQTGFETFFGIDDASGVVYAATCTELATGTTGLDSIWMDDMPIAVEGQPVAALPNRRHGFHHRPGVTANGVPYWIGGLVDATTGASAGQALFVGASVTVVLATGDALGGAPQPVGGTIGLGVRMSALGTHYIDTVTTTAPSAANTHVVVDGHVLQTPSGARFTRGTVVPASDGGDGVETWENWGHFGIDETGRTFVSGDTSAATSADGFLARDGAIVLREGQVLDGLVLAGSPANGACLNESGELAFVWGTAGGGAALFVEGRAVLRVGDEVDWDGDGNVDAEHVVTAFTGVASVSSGNQAPGGPARGVYFTADVRTGAFGPVLEGFFRIGLADAGRAFCAGDGSLGDHTTPCPCGNDGARGHGCAHSFDASGARLAATGDELADDVVLHASSEPATSFTLFLQHTSLGDTPFHDGVLCAGGTLVRLRGRAAVSGEASFPNGAFAQDATTTLSQRGGVFPGQGVSRFYSAWYRNASTTFCPPATANVSNGWRVDW